MSVPLVLSFENVPSRSLDPKPLVCVCVCVCILQIDCQSHPHICNEIVIHEQRWPYAVNTAVATSSKHRLLWRKLAVSQSKPEQCLKGRDKANRRRITPKLIWINPKLFCKGCSTSLSRRDQKLSSSCMLPMSNPWHNKERYRLAISMVYSSVPPVVIMDEYVALTLLRTGPIYGSVLDISTVLNT